MMAITKKRVWTLEVLLATGAFALSCSSGKKSTMPASEYRAQECNLSEADVDKRQSAGALLVGIHPALGGKYCAQFVEKSEMDALAEQAEERKSSDPGGDKPKHKVYDDFDTPDNGNEIATDDGVQVQLENLVTANSEMMTLHELGRSHQGRVIYGIHVSDPAIPEEEKEDVLFVSMHHAREWVSVEVTMRWLYWVAAAKQEPDVRALLQKTNIWVVPVLNPDGYQYTFDVNRLWRKNLRDNNGDGKIDSNDGVDLNRNYPYLWGYDEYGSSKSQDSGVYRGPTPGSEPETQALMGLIEKKNFRYGISFHSMGNLILYPAGYQSFYKTPDHPIFEYLAGTPGKPAITDSAAKEPYAPMLSAGLYTTNGEFTEYAYYSHNMLGFTVELTTGNGFEYPDDETLLETLFQDNKPFIMDLIRSTVQPDSPKSHIRKDRLADVHHRPVVKSFGDLQEVELSVRKGHATKIGFQETVASEATKRDVTIVDRGVFFETAVGRISNRPDVKEMKYFAEILVDGEAKRYPDQGYYAYTVVDAVASDILVVNGTYADASADQAGQVFVQAMRDAGFEGAYHYLVAQPGELLRYPDLFSHYKKIFWFTGAGKMKLPLQAQWDELAKAQRSGKKIFFSGQNPFSLPGDAEKPDGEVDAEILADLIASSQSFFAFGSQFLDLSYSPPVPYLSYGQVAALDTAEGSIFGESSVAVKLPDTNHVVTRGVGTQVFSSEKSFPLAGVSSGVGYRHLDFKADVQSETASLKFEVFSNRTSQIFVEVKQGGADWVALPLKSAAATKLEKENSFKWFCTPLLEAHPELERYFANKEDCAPVVGADGNPALQYVSGLGEITAEADLSEYLGKELDIRVSYIDAGFITKGNAIFVVQDIAVDEVPLDLGGVSKTDKGWLTEISGPMRQPAGGVVMQDAVFLNFGLESVVESADRASILKSIDAHFR